MDGAGFAFRTACLLLGVGLLGAGLAFSEPASAVKPVNGARYADYDGAVTVYLRVSKSGRWLNPRGSVLDPGGSECSARVFRLGSRRRPIRIEPTGHFRVVRRYGRLVLRVRGRFATRNRVNLRYRYRREPRRPRPGYCDDVPGTLTPERIRRIQFTSCRSHRVKTVLSAPTGRVFWQPQWDDRDGWMTIAYACLFSENKRFRLHQDDDDDSDLSLLRFVGPYLAYAWSPCAEPCMSFKVVEVRDLRTGKLAQGGDAHSGNILDLELKENGSVAVIANPNSLPPPRGEKTVLAVWAYDALGAGKLDTGDISPRSLRLTGSSLTWIRDGVTQSATLE